eukprot:2461701-Rhodomonas_salina.1
MVLRRPATDLPPSLAGDDRCWPAFQCGSEHRYFQGWRRRWVPVEQYDRAVGGLRCVCCEYWWLYTQGDPA